jgi:hypothetical protein
MHNFPFMTNGPLLTKYRVYDPAQGRWWSRDPIAERGGINLYGYVGGNFVNRVDPSGLNAVTGFNAGYEKGGILGGIGGAASSILHGEAIFDKPKQCEGDKDCSKIQAEINALVSSLKQREGDLLIDRHYLYEDHKKICDAHPQFGSWEGHIQRYLNEQQDLRYAIAEAQRLRCSYNPEADELANSPPPNKPYCY